MKKTRRKIDRINRIDRINSGYGFLELVNPVKKR